MNKLPSKCHMDVSGSGYRDGGVCYDIPEFWFISVGSRAVLGSEIIVVCQVHQKAYELAPYWWLPISLEEAICAQVINE